MVNVVVAMRSYDCETCFCYLCKSEVRIPDQNQSSVKRDLTFGSLHVFTDSVKQGIQSSTSL